jgi:hypothetical protein
LDKWRKLPEEEKAKLRVNDEIDQAIDTDDLDGNFNNQREKLHSESEDE